MSIAISSILPEVPNFIIAIMILILLYIVIIKISYIIQEIKNYLPLVPNLIVATIIATLFYIVIFLILKFITVFLILCGLTISLNISIHIILTFILLLIIIFYLLGYECHMGQKYLNGKIIQNNEYIHGNFNGEYSAILIANDVSWAEKQIINLSIRGLKYLEQYFQNTHKDYKIFQKIDKPIFDRIVSDIKCQELYFLGHGSKGTFYVNIDKSENLWGINYLEYKDNPKKRIIAQLHCAAIHHKRNNVSLVDLLATDVDNSYVGDGYITFIEVWRYCNKMLKMSK